MAGERSRMRTGSIRFKHSLESVPQLAQKWPQVRCLGRAPGAAPERSPRRPPARPAPASSPRSRAGPLRARVDHTFTRPGAATKMDSIAAAASRMLRDRPGASSAAHHSAASSCKRRD